MPTPLASKPTQLCALKALSREGLVVLARSLRCSSRRIALACGLQTAPRDHRQYNSNSAHQRIKQKFPKYLQTRDVNSLMRVYNSRPL